MILTEEINQKFKDRKIKKAVLKNGLKVRVFMAEGGYICQFKKGSSRRGYPIDLDNIESFVEVKSSTEEDKDKATFRIINKFRKEALKATFTNDFIKDCIALPDTFEKWVEEGKKSPYQYSVTTGCKITGDLISVETVAKNYWNGNALKQAIVEKKDFSSGTFRFQGYDGSVQFKKEENGEFKGWLSKEYKDCGNGYYYLLINDKYFIGYDVD